ncbi:UvrD-helicase domain-containing protein [Soonwooa sp.]|uniref:UvrD-helicase domain-containing protein n=1 Tax=Soonwooa sp. TaxID=1938592 RepID=UPI0028A1E7B5|nr:UvrD-helicase domain-containing protein [Soonwooa sp.]
MTITELNNWLRLQQNTLDKLIYKAGLDFYNQNKSRKNFGYDISECQKESYNLSQNKDLCYDRPNTAFCYSLWYHARRVNTFLSYFAETLLKNEKPIIEFFDLGAGTGAVQWAIGLIYHKMKVEGMKVPKIKIINIDTSPFMLYYSRDYLWKHFITEYNECNDFSNHIEYEINSWNNTTDYQINNPWITASYLFDISDTSDGTTLNIDYKNSVKNGFNELIRKFNPTTVLLLTSDQPEKRQFLKELEKEFANKGYFNETINSGKLILDGRLNNVSNFRQQLYDYYSPWLDDYRAQSLRNPTNWKDFSYVGTILHKAQNSLFEESIGIEKKELQLYNPPIKVRREIVLNREQSLASIHDHRPTIITGPAGCGKSVVITERIKNLIEESEYSPDLNILITTFNKQLIAYLSSWISDLLDPSKVEKVMDGYKFKTSNRRNITLLHFDVLPTRLGNINGNLFFNDTLRAIANEAIQFVKTDNKITTNKFDKVLSADYVIEEYHRVIYGLQYETENDFLTSERKGRPRLKINGENRKILWKAVWKFLDILENNKNSDSVITRRHKFLRKLRNNEISIKYSHIFVDEFQDCTQADYQIFDLLLKDPNNLVLAGDIAQAIQIGNVADIPRIRTDEMANRKTHKLKGSYRLPFRISECITKITEIIEGGNIITPYKGAPPGARPIVLYASTPNELKEKIVEIYNSYKVFELDKITILEKDFDINTALNTVHVSSETDTILRLKGMEKTCILWSTRKDIEYKDEVAEFVYTILTRTSGILLIVLTTQTLEKYHKIIKLLRKDRLILWDKETEANYNKFCIETKIEDEVELD